ncbi:MULTISPECIES: STAS/SEC14 domain-containing protein [unclassified Arthrobacter]|uniref:DUF7793 family protein n=1 Tax=unclassified Arthrobacter TaxID=235627 RepID=UPI0029CAB03A|nr:STAS/SEC14 domain-containing protein [Arthrobacter sp. YA7-1]
MRTNARESYAGGVGESSAPGVVSREAGKPDYFLGVAEEIGGCPGEDVSVVPETADGEKSSVVLRADGLLHLRWAPGVAIQVDDAREAMAKVNELCQQEQHPMLVDMAAVASVSREARGVWSIPCGASRIALLGTSPVDRVLANFFLGVHVPPCPTRFFTSRSEAMDWLDAGA